MNWLRFSNPLTASATHAQEIVSYAKQGADSFELCLKFPDLTIAQCERIRENVGGRPTVESVRAVEGILRPRRANPHCSHVWVLKALMDDGGEAIFDIYEELEDAQRAERKLKTVKGVVRTAMDYRPVK